MSDRLRHLQRQRALLSEHLAWIDSEIARETPAPSAAPAATTPAESIAPSPSPAASPEVPAEADALIEKYAAQERQNPDDLRRGCLYVFASAVILLAAGVTAVWLLFYR
ncbi:MAG: hypothetical protein ACAH89_02020 [Rariglobus sp.]|nr:hypothetical protein [Rariglobus sp.]